MRRPKQLNLIQKKFVDFNYHIYGSNEYLEKNGYPKTLKDLDLGSGAVLAMHDLEIRGGGNIIGEAQSGQIKNVGYSMYIKLLEDSLRDLSGEAKSEKEVEIKLNINAYISSELVEDERVRIEIYRRLSMVKTLEDIYNIQKELIDRFGKIDTPTNNFLEKMKIKVLATKKGVETISNYGENITIIYPNDKKFIKAKAKDDIIIIETILQELQ
jgi:transcription-repair coupling factor (superfamily II helicase)